MDTQGRDILSRVIYGAEVSLSIGLITQCLNSLIGILLGLTAGFVGRWWDDLVMGLTNIMLSIPALVLALAIMAVLGPGLFNVFLALGFTNWSYSCRVTRSQVLAARSLDYVLAARALGQGQVRIMLQQILPNIVGPILVIATLGVAYAILTGGLPVVARPGRSAADAELGRHALHDAARPCLSRAALEAMISALVQDDVGGLLAVPAADTLKRGGEDGRVLQTVPRDQIWQAQTPQMFRRGLLLRALEHAGSGVTDEAGAVEALGLRPRLVPGETRNIKVTVPQDLALAELILRSMETETRRS